MSRLHGIRRRVVASKGQCRTHLTVTVARLTCVECRICTLPTASLVQARPGPWVPVCLTSGHFSCEVDLSERGPRAP
eukprot:3027-Rhodomonas_salina.1